jgi:hypothetical protein
MTDQAGLPPGVGAIRFARRTTRLHECVSFYRDLVGLPLLMVFDRDPAQDGVAGAIFSMPKTDVTFKLVEASEPLAIDSHEQLVLYFADYELRDRTAQRLRDAGLRPVTQYRYWADNDAVTFSDPDGRDVVLAPWVFGQAPPPARSKSRPAPGLG